MNIREFDPVIYPFRLWVVIGGTDKEISEFLQYNGTDIEDIGKETSKSEAFAMPVMSKKNYHYGVVVYFVNRKVMACSAGCCEKAKKNKE